MYVLDLGDRDYKEVWELQKTIHEKRVNEELPNTLLLVEHNPVITMGKSGQESNVLFPEEFLKEKDVDFYHIERGGDATYHGPGQLVGYPIFNVHDGLAGIKPFITGMEEAIIATLHGFGIEGYKKEDMIGVWTDWGKVCSIGIAVKKWVSFHGFALNVNTDLSYFDLIVPCGLKNVEMTSMQRILGKKIPMNEVKKSIIRSFGLTFDQDVKQVCLEEII
ncbi:MAG: lipoyl(octanoyl) transferase LipB [candidate division WOR-3 bacterium]|nr:lipoyl(octanoyl) transferase LipB [candidate division WOR-3 bacterium]